MRRLLAIVLLALLEACNPAHAQSMCMGMGMNCEPQWAPSGPVFDFNPEVDGSINTGLTGYSFTRATAATTWNASGNVATVSTGTPRYAEHPDLGNGYWAEAAATNQVTYDTALDGNWSLYDAGDSLGGSVVAPDGSTCTDCCLIGDSTTGYHGLELTLTLSASATVFSYWVLMQDEDRTWAQGGANRYAVWGTDDWVLDSKGSLTTDLGCNECKTTVDGEWCRCTQSFTALSSAVNYGIFCGGGNYSGGDANPDCCFWGVQIEQGQASYATSLIHTSGSAGTRNLDALTYTGTMTNQAGSAVVEYTYPFHTNFRLLRLGSSNADQIVLGHTAAERPNSTGKDGSSVVWSITGTGLTAGQRYTQALSWDVDDVTYYLDGSSIGTDSDTGGALPDYSTNIYIGYNGANPNGIIHSVKLYDVTEVTE